MVDNVSDKLKKMADAVDRAATRLAETSKKVEAKRGDLLNRTLKKKAAQRKESAGSFEKGEKMALEALANAGYSEEEITAILFKAAQKRLKD